MNDMIILLSGAGLRYDAIVPGAQAVRRGSAKVTYCGVSRHASPDDRLPTMCPVLLMPEAYAM